MDEKQVLLDVIQEQAVQNANLLIQVKALQRQLEISKEADSAETVEQVA